MKNEIETVTVKLETYENMQREIEMLRKKVAEKTIYKHIIDPTLGMIICFAFFLLFFYIDSLLKL